MKKIIITILTVVYLAMFSCCNQDTRPTEVRIIETGDTIYIPIYHYPDKISEGDSVVIEKITPDGGLSKTQWYLYLYEFKDLYMTRPRRLQERGNVIREIFTGIVLYKNKN